MLPQPELQPTELYRPTLSPEQCCQAKEQFHKKKHLKDALAEKDCFGGKNAWTMERLTLEKLE